MEQDAIISVRGLTAAYGDEVILKDISFEVKRGEVFVILGGIRQRQEHFVETSDRIVSPRRGRSSHRGRQPGYGGRRQRQKILRRFGVAYQSGALFGSMTLKENVSLPLEEFTRLPVEARNVISWMKLKLVGLEGFGSHLPAEVSGGMQKRAAIARAMALDPAVLFLDEPSAGLDPITSAELDALILSLREGLGMTFVIVTHELPSIYAVADRVIMLDKRKKGISAEGRPQDLRDHSQDPYVRRFFRREAE